jgi:hypothetical protein
VIVAPGDDEILFHLPLDSRTYLAARWTVATKHLAIQALPLSAGPALAAAIRWQSPLAAALIPAAMVWVAAFALVLSFGLHRLLLRFMGGQRLRTLLAYVPVAVSLLLALGPQMMPAMLHTDDVSDRSPTREALGAWALALPPAWFSGVVEAAQGAFEPTVLARAAVGLLVVPVGAALVIGWLARGFLEELLRLVADRDSGAASARARRPGPGAVARRLFGLSSDDARAGWLLHEGAMRSRDARARAFGVVAPALMFAVLGAVNPQSAFQPEVIGFLAGFSMAGLIGFWPYHEHKDAAWLYEAVGPRRYGQFLRGMLARTIVRGGLLVVAAALLSAALRGEGVLGYVGAMGSAAAGLLTVPVALLVPQPPPFSCAFRAGEASAGSWRRGGFLLVAGIAAGFVAALGHFVPWSYALTIPGALAVATLGSAAVLAKLDRRPPPALQPERPAGPRPARG